MGDSLTVFMIGSSGGTSCFFSILFFFFFFTIFTFLTLKRLSEIFVKEKTITTRKIKTTIYAPDIPITFEKRFTLVFPTRPYSEKGPFKIAFSGGNAKRRLNQ